MAQSPFQVDALQIEPGAAGTRTIDRDIVVGALRFIDPENTSGVTLSELAGLRSIGSILMVGKSGPGAQFNTITDAVAAVPTTSSLIDPTLILVGPGLYQENVVIEKDGVWVHGLGGAILEASVADAAITIQKNVTTTPNWCRIQNLRVVNANNGEECVRINGGVGSEVGSVEVSILDCDLVASGVGTYQVRADTVDKVRVQGGTFGESSGTSLVLVTNCHQMSLSNIDRMFDVQMDYDTGNPIPSLVGSSYSMKGCTLLGDVQSSLTGAGSLTLSGVVAEQNGDLTLGGDGAGTFKAVGCSLGNMAINGSAPLTLVSSSRGSAAGAGTLAEDILEGSVSFAASSSEAVVFDVEHPDDSYTVHPETELTEAIGVTSKDALGFTLSFSGAQTTTVNFKVLRRV
jgi:hypothetical protein